jgi:hypothetical protein
METFVTKADFAELRAGMASFASKEELSSIREALKDVDRDFRQHAHKLVDAQQAAALKLERLVVAFEYHFPAPPKKDGTHPLDRC